MYYVLVITLVLCWAKHIECFPAIESLHEYMTPLELAYIFNTDEKHNIPEYEIVYLPIFKTTKSVRRNTEEDGIYYGFFAFGR